jgi:hypothetical protein
MFCQAWLVVGREIDVRIVAKFFRFPKIGRWQKLERRDERNVSLFFSWPGLKGRIVFGMKRR